MPIDKASCTVSTLNCHWGQFWAHAAVPVGPWQDPCRLLTLVHVSDLPPNCNMTWKNKCLKIGHFSQLSTGKCSFELMQQHYHFEPHWLLCSGPCGPPIGPLLVTHPRTCYWYIIKCKNHPKNHPIKETKPEKAFGTVFNLKPSQVIMEACNSPCEGLN